MTLIDFLTHQMQTNQFLTAALVAAPATALTYSVRTFPMKVYQAVKRQATLHVQFNSDMADYEVVSRFISSLVIDRFSRKFVYQTESKFDWETYEDETKHHGLTVGYGTHLGRYKGTLCWIERDLSESANTDKFKEHITVRFLTRRKAILQTFAQEIAVLAGTATEEFTHVKMNINSGRHWSRAGKLPLRRLETVFSANDAANKLVAHIKGFDDKREWNRERGLPHRTGIILKGPPGNGKSSMIHAVASATGRSLHYLNLGAVENDKELTDLMASPLDWSKTMLVLEDFDAAGAAVSRVEGEKDEKRPITLSTMLNVLDGLISPDGLVVIATTNHPERIDEALQRPGRFDLQVELGNLGWSQFLAMARLFDLDPNVYNLPTFVEMSGAKMRSLLLEGGVAAVERWQENAMIAKAA